MFPYRVRQQNRSGKALIRKCTILSQENDIVENEGACVWAKENVVLARHNFSPNIHSTAARLSAL